MVCCCRSTLVPLAIEQEDDDVPQGRHHLRRGSFVDSAGVLTERAIADPVQAILDGPLIVYPAWIVLGVPALVCLINTVAAWYPAARAARVDPRASAHSG